mgnify:CR=1 FL=1
MNTSIVGERDLSFLNTDQAVLKSFLTEELAVHSMPDGSRSLIQTEIDKLNTADTDPGTLHNTLLQVSPFYSAVIKEMREILNLLPPSAAMAGIYTQVDNARGVWKAPANVSVTCVTFPAVHITHDEQEDLNIPLSGKAVNAIRSFPGEGIKVWGARTLDGNSLDWRYINVRRTMIMLEQSIKNAVRAYLFEPNVANTWLDIKYMIDSFLTG